MGDMDRLPGDIQDTDELEKVAVGRRIVAVELEPDSGEDWAHGENSVRLELDDGGILYFVGYGYDASGLATSYTPPQA